MFGMLFEMLNDEATGIAPVEAMVTPSATAIAHVRTKPVMRETSVETDMVAVERAMEGAAMVVSGCVRWSDVLLAILPDGNTRTGTSASPRHLPVYFWSGTSAARARTRTIPPDPSPATVL